MIIHAGDYVSMAVLDQLNKFRSFRGVCGNMDPPEIKLDLPEETTFDLAGCRIGLAHPAQGGPPSGIQNALITRLKGVDLVVYGHPHKETLEILKKFAIAFFRTDELGMIKTKSDGENILVN